LRAIQELCETRGARFIMLIPPTLISHDPAPTLAADAAKGGIHVLVPYLPGEMPAKDFSDGFHLNPSGAALFTARLDTILPSQLSPAPF